MQGVAYAPSPVNFNEIFPIGSIYISVNDTNPGTLFGGSWTQIKDTFLMCGGDTYTKGSTGGSATHAHTTADHTLTVSEMPWHQHEFQRQQWYAADTQIATTTIGSIYSWKSSTGGTTSYGYKGGDYGGIGGSQGHNHGDTYASSSLPPYLAVVVWKRVG